MVSTEIKYLISKLEEAFAGNPWYGDAVMTKLENVDFKFADVLSIYGQKTSDLTTETVTEPHSHSIAQIVKHMIQWRLFAIEKMEGNEEYDIELNTKVDWPNTNIPNEVLWKKLLNELRQTQIDVISVLSNKADVFLTDQVPGKSYDYRYLIEGVIQHDIYHLGQIGLLMK